MKKSIAFFAPILAALVYVNTAGLDLPISPDNTDAAVLVSDSSTNPIKDDIPPVFYGEELDASSDSIIYVIDCSGSMGGPWDSQPFITADGQHASGYRIDRAKAELIRSIDHLPKNFKFNIVSYDCVVHRWQPRMVFADETNKALAVGWVRSQEATDSTATGPAVSLALSERDNHSIVLLTDGAPNCGTPNQQPAEHRNMIRSANLQGAVITVFGIAASGQYRTFCQNVASDSGGQYYDIP